MTSLRSGWPAFGVLATAALAFALSACDVPFGLGSPSTRTLEDGAASTLSASFEMTGTYTDTRTLWTIDLEVASPGKMHVLAGASDVKLEAIIVGGTGYFRGQQFLAQHLGNDQASQNLVKVAGNMWWRSTSATFLTLPDFTNGQSLRSTFLGPTVTKRTDHASVDGVPAVEMSSPRADVFIQATAPFRLLRVHLAKDAVIDGISDADFRFSNFDRDFQISPPMDVIDFSNLSTLPPVYTVIFVDTSQCATPCRLSATLKNVGGLRGALGQSTVTFTVTDPATGNIAGTCKAPVGADVGHNATTTVSCSIAQLNSQQLNAATVTATVDNPGRG